jgi:hypothetical protein
MKYYVEVREWRDTGDRGGRPHFYDGTLGPYSTRKSRARGIARWRRKLEARGLKLNEDFFVMNIYEDP